MKRQIVETMQEYNSSAAHLPPKPATDTGQPRPPRAEVDSDSGRTLEEQNDRFKPSPPAGQGPVLEWYKPSRLSSILSGSGAFVLVGIGLSLKDGSADWTHTWWMWLFPVIAGLLIASTIRVSKCSAGAEWFSTGKNWVNVYDLASIKLRTPANYRKLDLEDNSRRKITIQLSIAQHNRALWDLVYNGMRHSVVHNDVEVNRLARRVFDLPT